MHKCNHLIRLCHWVDELPVIIMELTASDNSHQSVRQAAAVPCLQSFPPSICVLLSSSPLTFYLSFVFLASSIAICLCLCSAFPRLFSRRLFYFHFRLPNLISSNSNALIHVDYYRLIISFLSKSDFC